MIPSSGLNSTTGHQRHPHAAVDLMRQNPNTVIDTDPESQQVTRPQIQHKLESFPRPKQYHGHQRRLHAADDPTRNNGFDHPQQYRKMRAAHDPMLRSQ